VTEHLFKTLFVELNKLYQGEVLPPLKIQYKDYSNWQKNMSESEFIKRQEKYWLRVFSGETPALNMPYDYPRPTVHSSQGGLLVL